jgi:hypothetical protein
MFRVSRLAYVLKVSEAAKKSIKSLCMLNEVKNLFPKDHARGARYALRSVLY